MSTTEQNGYAIQFLAYTCIELGERVPFGETLAEQWFLSGAEGQNSTSYHSPFKFSAKEKDIEMRSIREDHKKQALLSKPATATSAPVIIARS